MRKGVALGERGDGERVVGGQARAEMSADEVEPEGDDGRQPLADEAGDPGA